MRTLFTQDKAFSFDDLKAGVTTGDEYLDATLDFCNKWLNGTEVFTFNTSGSTGAPTVLEAKRWYMQMSAQTTIDVLKLTPEEHVYLCISTRMIGGAMMLVRALLLGCDITVVHPTSNPVEHIDPEHNYSFASFVPMQLYEVTSDEKVAMKLDRFENILLGGAAAGKEMLDVLAKLHCRVWQTYGMTETLSHIALKRVGVDEYLKVLPGVRIKTDERNCLCINSPVTGNTWLLTNDVVRLIDEKKFELLGRIDDVINSGGIKVFSYDVEHAIVEKMNDLGLPYKPLFVCKKTDARFSETVVVVMLGEPLPAGVLDQLTEYCKRSLGKYAAPKHFYFVSEFEKLESGKINKPATLEKALKTFN